MSTPRPLKMYYLSELPEPEPSSFIDPNDMRLSTLPYYDILTEEFYAIISVQNVLPRHKVVDGHAGLTRNREG